MKLNDLTPEAFICKDCPACPAVLETENDTYIIIGKKLSPEAEKLVEGRVNDDEWVIEIPKGLVDGAVKGTCETKKAA